MKTMNKLLSLLLCAIMVFSMLPVQAFATETEIDSQSQVTEATEVEVTEEVSSTEDSDNQTVLGGGTTEPSEETTEASEETTEATQASTEATQETTEATEESTEATQETTVATETAAQVAAVSAEVEVQAVAEDSVVKVTESDGTETGYKSLQEAFDAHFSYTNNKEMGGTYTVTLLADCDRAEISAKTDAYIVEPFNITLDLNGHSIISSDSSKSVLSITIGSANYPSTFTVTDSVGGGKITGGTCGIFFNGAKGTVELAGGTITGNHNPKSANGGGGICCNTATATVKMTGGVVSNNSVTGQSGASRVNSGLGGGVYTYNFVMTGGVISGNSAYSGGAKYGGRGGGLGMPITGAATVSITGGQIYGNYAENAGDDIMLQKNGRTALTYTLSDGAKYYVDGFKGVSHSDASGATSRYDASNPVEWITLTETSTKKTSVGLKVFYPVEYTVTYTDGVEGEEIFADQVYTVEENEATPAFEGETPARTGYTFGGWTPDVAETVTADVTYTAVWNVCEHQWGEPVVDETAATITKTCAVCGAVEVVNVVAKIESTGTYYETLQAAVDAAITLMATSEQETITMVNDTKESVEISWLGINACNLTIDFAGHTVTGNGGSVFTVNRYTSYKAKMTVFFNDSVGGGTVTGGAAEKGGAIYAAKGAPVIIINGGTWTGNTATNGGVIYVSGQTSGSVTINGGTFTGNTAEKNGGAIYARYLTVAGGTITGNTAASGGGVYAFSGYSQKFDMAGGAVYGNTATVDGDDIIWRANQGNTSTSYLKLIAASDMNAGVQNWYHDNEGSRFSVDNAIVFEDYAKYTTRKIRVALKAAGAICTITYTDGVEGEELFADQSYKAVSGTATPAFEGTPTREGYEFAGWTPEFSETVTGDVAYTATWAPAAPDKYGKNVINPLVTVICDSDEDHAPVTGKWYPQNCKILPSGSKPVWDETLGTWTIGVRLDSLTMFYVSELEDAYNNIHHELANEKTYIDTTLKWDAEQLLWVPTEALEVHATCQTMPTAPTHIQLKSYQIKVHGTVDGEDKVYTTSIPEGSYVVGEVKGSREEGFTVDVTVTIENDDLFITNWIAKRDPGVAYVYDWDKTPATVTFTLTYNGSLTGTLYGDRHGSNNYDWIIGFNYKNQPLTYGAVADAYVEKAWFVTYTDGIEGEEIFADQVYRVGDGNNTPAFDSIPTREGYVFAGWEPAVAETVTADVTYVAQWKEYFEVVVYSVTDGNKDKAEQIFAGDILEGENLTEWLDENVEIAEVVGYTVDKWYNWDAYGEKIADTTVVDGAVNVYITYTVNTYTVTLDPAGGEVEPTSIKVTYGKAVGELPVPTREGYTFAGWVVAESKARAVFDTAGTVVTAETVYDVAADSTLVAQWTANEYTVTLDPNGGELTEDELEVTYGEPVGKLPAPTRDGYYFAGWVDKDGKAVTEETLYGVAGDSTIIATWQKIYIKDPSSPATGDTGITMTAIVCMLSGALLLVLMSQKKRLFR